MSDSEHRKLTPVGFAPFEEPRDTDRAAHPPEEETRPATSLEELTEAVDRLESAFETHAGGVRDALNGLRTIVLRQHSETHKRLDNHAAVARWLVAEAKTIRQLSSFPPVEPPTDDL